MPVTGIYARFHTRTGSFSVLRSSLRHVLLPTLYGRFPVSLLIFLLHREPTPQSPSGFSHPEDPLFHYLHCPSQCSRAVPRAATAPQYSFICYEKLRPRLLRSLTLRSAYFFSFIFTVSETRRWLDVDATQTSSQIDGLHPGWILRTSSSSFCGRDVFRV